MLVAIDGHSDEDWGDERPEIGSDTTERESKVHALGEEGVCSAGDTTSQVRFQYTQKLIHLYIHTRHTPRHGCKVPDCLR